LVRVIPVAIRCEILGAPNVFVEILDVVFESLRKITLTLRYPGVDSIRRRGGEQVPVAGIFAVSDEFRRTAVAQGKPRSVRIDAGAATVANGQTNASFVWHVNSVQAGFLGGEGGFRRVDFEVLVRAVKLREAQR